MVKGAYTYDGLSARSYISKQLIVAQHTHVRWLFDMIR